MAELFNSMVMHPIAAIGFITAISLGLAVGLSPFAAMGQITVIVRKD